MTRGGSKTSAKLQGSINESTIKSADTSISLIQSLKMDNWDPSSTSHSGKYYFIFHVLDFWNQYYFNGFAEYDLNTHKITRFEILHKDETSSTAVSNVTSESIDFGVIAVHSSRLFSFRVHDVYGFLRNTEDRNLPVYIGSNLHFSSGYELQLFDFCQHSGKKQNKLTIVFKTGALKEDRWNGFIWVFVPSTVSKLGFSGATPHQNVISNLDATSSDSRIPLQSRFASKLCEVGDPITDGKSNLAFGSVWKIPVCLNINVDSSHASSSESFELATRTLLLEW
jgi:hypothetical protein